MVSVNIQYKYFNDFGRLLHDLRLPMIFSRGFGIIYNII